MSHHCRLAILTVLLSFCLVLPLSGMAKAQEADPYPFGLGVYLHRVMDDSALLGRVADLAAGAGTGWTREEFEWSVIQPSPGSYDQTRLNRFDTMVDRAEARGIRIVGLIRGPSAWSGGYAPSTKAEYEDFADFAAFLAKRYQGRINHWEIWNEPNTARFWAPEPDPAAYAALLKKVYPAIRKAAPQAQVLAGALSDPQDLVYLYAMFAHGISDYLDILSVHPYTSPNPLENSGEETNLRLLSQLTGQFGERKPVWVTEMGFPTCATAKGVTQERQAQLLVRAYLAALSAGVEVVQWYDFRDDGIDSGDSEQMFGLVTHQSADQPLSPKPAYHAFGAMTAVLGTSLFKEEVEIVYDFRGLVFQERASSKKTLVLWLIDQAGENRVIDFTLGLRGALESVRGLYGEDILHQFDGTSLSLELTGSPIYIRGYFQVE